MRLIPWTIALAASVLSVACGSSSNKSSSPSPTSSAQALQSFCQKARAAQEAAVQLSQAVAAAPVGANQRSQQAVTLAERFAALAKQMAEAAPSAIRADAGYVAGVVEGGAQTFAESKGDLSTLQTINQSLAADTLLGPSLMRLQEYQSSKCT